MPVPAETLPPRPLLRDTVLDRIRDAIVDGTLAPDEQLRDAELAAWLGVSRTPVREALLELGRAGLVTAVPGRTTVVASLDLDAVREAQAVVGAMHRVAVITAVPRLGADDLARMRAANERFRAAHAAGDADAAHRADREFHAVAVDACGNAAVRAVLDRYEPVLVRAELLRFASHEGGRSADRHDRIVELCEAGLAHEAGDLAELTWSDLLPRDDGAAPA